MNIQAKKITIKPKVAKKIVTKTVAKTVEKPVTKTVAVKNNDVAPTVESTIGIVLRSDQFKVDSDKNLKDLSFSEDEITSGTGIVSGDFIKTFYYKISMTTAGKFKYRYTDESDGEEKEKMKDSVNIIPICFFPSYRLAYSVLSGVRDDHSEWSKWDEEERKQIVCISYGGAKSGYCPTKGNFEISGWSDWLTDKNKRRKLRTRTYCFGFDLVEEKLVLLQLGGSCLPEFFNYSQKVQANSLPFWIYGIQIDSKEMTNENNDSYFSIHITQRKEYLTVKNNKEKQVFYEKIVLPLLEQYKSWAQSIEKLIFQIDSKDGNVTFIDKSTEGVSSSSVEYTEEEKAVAMAKLEQEHTSEIIADDELPL